MSRTKQKKSVELEITQFANNGNGLGFFKKGDGNLQEVEVPFTMPGDSVRCLLLRKRKGLYTGLLEEITRPSSQRIVPKCRHFGTCGGCRWQHLAYEKQLEIKEHRIRHYFAPFLTYQVDIRPILPCVPPWEYRNKMEFTFSSNAAKTSFLGLHIDSSRGKVFNLDECHLVRPWFSEALAAVREWWKETGLDAYHPHKNTGSLRLLTLRESMSTEDRLVMLTVSGNPDYAVKKQHLEMFTAFIRSAVEPVNPNANLSVFMRVHQITKGQPTNFYEFHLYGPDHLRETLNIVIHPNDPPAALSFKISPTAFFQPNTRQAEQLYSQAISLAEINSGDVVYDLYCGTGTLGICAAKKAKHVVGIDIAPESTLDAQANAKTNGIDNIAILTGSVPDVIQAIRNEKSHPLPNIVVVDPPRAGLDPNAIQQVLQLSPQKIVYISCNPATQAENIKEFIAAGYRIHIIQPVDQFPQTFHVENIAILEKVK